MKASHRALQEDGTTEGARWLQNVEAASAALPPEVECIHTRDHEGDSYALFAALMAQQERFVIRCCYDTRCAGGKLREVLTGAPVAPETRPVQICQRGRSPLLSCRLHALSRQRVGGCMRALLPAHAGSHHRVTGIRFASDRMSCMLRLRVISHVPEAVSQKQ